MNEIVGRPVIAWICGLVAGRTREKACGLFRIMAVKLQRYFWRCTRFGEKSGPGCNAGTRFSVKRNLLEKALDYPRGNVSVEHKTSQL